MQIEKIAFIGAGVMGHSMITNLLKAGFKVTVYNRTRAKAEDLVPLGATLADSPAQAAADADLAISIVGYPQDVRETWLGEKGLLQTLRAGALGLDMTTSEPDLAKEISKKAALRGVLAGDAPVTGGDVGARNGTLTILFGGDEQLFEAVKPVCAAMGKSFTRFGGPGAGQYAKLCNQIAIAAGMMALCECIVSAEKFGLDREQLITTLSAGAAGSFSMSSYGPRILKGDFKPGFYIKHFIKDLKIALDCAARCSLQLPGTELALKLYQQLADEGKGDLGTQGLYQYYLQHA